MKWINCSIWRKWQPTPVFFPRKSYGQRSLVQATVHGVTKSWTRLSDFTLTFHFHALEKEMATHSSVLAWRIPGMGEPDGLPSMGSHRVGHDWSALAVAAASWWIFYSWLCISFSFILIKCDQDFNPTWFISKKIKMNLLYHYFIHKEIQICGNSFLFVFFYIIFTYSYNLSNTRSTKGFWIFIT